MKLTTVDYLFEPLAPAPAVAATPPNAITTAQDSGIERKDAVAKRAVRSDHR